MDIEIKKATLSDIDLIVKIENECFSTPWSAGSVNEALSNPCSHFYIALLDGIPAGYIGLQIFSGEGYITNVATLPEYRRRGVARALILRAMENETEFITLEVRESNLPAISLYSSLGFERVGIRPRFYREPEENAILMTRKFRSLYEDTRN
jgi:ribosomal-protein-alanine N-acetyltransferase